MRVISTLCLLLFFTSCFSQINDRIILSEYEAKNELTRQNNISLCRMGGVLSSDKNLSKLQESIIARDTLNNILTSKISGVNILAVPQNSADKPATIRMHCMRTLTEDDEPLIVIDGIPVDEKNWMSSININDIESIDILKASVASAIFGCRAAKGVILITTKYTNQRKFIIKDFLDGNPIAGATVSFISYDKKDTIMTAANDSGVVVVDKLRNTENYIVSVTAVGYKSFTQSYKINSAKEQTILLERLPKTCTEVVLSIIGEIRRIGCGGSICVIKNTEDSIIETNFFQIKPFPNPVQRGNSFNFRFNASNNASVKITSLDGKQMLQKPIKSTGKEVFTIQTDSRWAAGIYFVQLYANGKLVASDKLVIQ